MGANGIQLDWNFIHQQLQPNVSEFAFSYQLRLIWLDGEEAEEKVHLLFYFPSLGKRFSLDGKLTQDWWRFLFGSPFFAAVRSLRLCLF